MSHKKCQIILPASGSVTLLPDTVYDVSRREFFVTQGLAVEWIDRHPATAERCEFREGLGQFTVMGNAEMLDSDDDPRGSEASGDGRVFQDNAGAVHAAQPPPRKCMQIGRASCR